MDRTNYIGPPPEHMKNMPRPFSPAPPSRERRIKELKEALAAHEALLEEAVGLLNKISRMSETIMACYGKGHCDQCRIRGDEIYAIATAFLSKFPTPSEDVK
jgi:hypothetical protein